LRKLISNIENIIENIDHMHKVNPPESS
jgi:hypothetical protein